MRMVVATRGLFTPLLSLLSGAALWVRMPFPDENSLLQLILLNKPYLFYGIKWTYLMMLFTTPYIGLSLLFSLVYIFTPRKTESAPGGKLPAYPEADVRDKLFLV